MLRKCLIVSVVLVFSVLAIKAMGAPQPVVYYTFDELGQVIKDASGNGNDGTPIGNVKLNDKGKFGKCFEFDGQRSYVELKRVVQDDFTLMAWIKTDNLGLPGTQAYQGTGLIWSDVGGVANDFIMALLEKKFSFFVGNPDQSITSSADAVTGDWVHVAATRNVKTSEIAIYVNGKKEKDLVHGNKGPLNALPTIAIGGNVLDNRFYTGLIDDPKIFDVALSEQEIQQVSAPASVDARSKLAATWGSLKAIY